VDNNQWTGMGKWAHRVARGLEQLGQAPALWFADDFPVMRASGRLAVLLFPVVLAVRLLAVRERFDAFVVHEPGGVWYGALRRLWPSLPPMVVMCHNVESHYFRTLLFAARRSYAEAPFRMRAKTRCFRHWQTDGAIQLADHVLCLSTIDRDYLVHRLGCSPRRVTCLINGVSAEHFADRPAGRPEHRVLFVGGWLDVKGRRLLPRLWSHVRARFPSARLTVVGAGQLAEVVLADFSPTDRESVSVIPRVTRETQMRDQFVAHDIFLMPSLSEGSPLALLEAMAAMLPVVASRVGGIPDVVTHGVDGLLFDPLDPDGGADLVCRLLGDPAEAHRLGRAGQERVRSLTWEATSRCVVAAVERVLSTAGVPAGRMGEHAAPTRSPAERLPLTGEVT
jgi:glycosyltransferase involved in cell wall biosynthesis